MNILHAVAELRAVDQALPHWNLVNTLLLIAGYKGEFSPVDVVYDGCKYLENRGLIEFPPVSGRLVVEYETTLLGRDVARHIMEQIKSPETVEFLIQLSPNKQEIQMIHNPNGSAKSLAQRYYRVTLDNGQVAMVYMYFVNLSQSTVIDLLKALGYSNPRFLFGNEPEAMYGQENNS